MTKSPAILAAVLLVPLCALSAPRPKDAADEALYFPTTVGSRWVYESPDGQYEERIDESKSEDKATVVTVVRTQGGEENWRSTVRVSPEGLLLIASGGVTYHESSPWLRTGLKPGAEWEYTYIRQTTAFHNHIKFVGFESVEVPAGKFEAVRLDGAETVGVGMANGNGPPTPGTEWYARGVGLVKRVRMGQGTTLKSFTPGK
jgi:hypothetical protein